ncbi:MAG: hypothetical protein RLZ64_1392 [Pseudomonadota bacterium]
MTPNSPHNYGAQYPSVPDSSVSDTSTNPSAAADPFDSRPGGDIREKSVLDRMREVLTNFSARCREASEWVQQKWAVLSQGSGVDFDIGVISKPRNFQRRQLPDDLLQGLLRIDAEKRKASAEVAFIESRDEIPLEALADKDMDEQAFENYTKLCRHEGKQLGTISCPHNFNDAAVRYAKVFIGQVEKRKATAEQKQAEFWLSSADQEKFEGAKLLLAQQDDQASKKLAEAASQLGQVHKNSSHHYLSFMAWLEWRNDTSQKPNDTEFSIDAALAYATQLMEDYAGRDVAAGSQMKALLNDAAELINKKQFYADLYDNLLMLETMVSLIAEIRAPEPDLLETAEIKIPHSIIPTPTPTQASTSTPAATPTLPPPRDRTRQPVTYSTLYNIPELSTFDPDVQSIGYAKLNQFFSDYGALVDKGTITIDPSDTFFALTAATAADFLNKASASPEGVESTMFAAANFLISEYRKYHAKQRSAN